MWKKWIQHYCSPQNDYQINDYKALLRYVNQLASHKLGYPVSLLTYLGVVDNSLLGIKSGSIANVLLNNVGDPFKDSETSLLEVKKHEREIIQILEKYYGVEKDQIRGYVTTGGTEGNFAGLWWSKRYLINKSIDSLITVDNKIKLQGKDEQELMAALAKVPLNDYKGRAEGLQKIIDIKNTVAVDKNVVQQLLTPTVFYTKNHTHYSIPKISEILRMNIRSVLPNDDGSMNINDFKKELIMHLGAYPHSPIVVITNIGTTITGAIDSVPDIKKILDEMPQKPLYTIHMDGALTGFVLPVLKPFGEVKNYFDAIGVSTLAVSAHKYPGMSQPCGILLARREFFEKAFEKGERAIEYVGNIQDVTITGSRSGLNVLMFYNALIALGMDKGTDKLTRMVKENLDNAQFLYQELIKLYGADKVYYPFHFNVMFPRPSQEMARKYQLMLTGEKATICVLTNVTRALIKQFIKDLKAEKEDIMTNIEIQTEYKIMTLDSEHIKSTMDLFIKSFCGSEPITKHLGIHYKDYEPFAREVVQKALKDGLCKIAVDKNERVIAFALAEDLADPFIPHLAHYPQLKPVFALVEQLSRPFMQNRKFIKGKVVHVWIAGVDEAYRGMHLSTQVDMACVEAAARKGFDYAYAEFTNELSENVTHQFKVLKLFNRIEYNSFRLDNGEAPFSGVKGAAASYVAAIRPGVNLDSLSNAFQVIEKTR
jgi:histidine decarboxylase